MWNFKIFAYIWLRTFLTSWIAIGTPTDRPKSVCSRCVIEVFGGVFVFTGAKRLYVPDGTQNQYGWRQRARFSIRIFAGVYIHL